MVVILFFEVQMCWPPFGPEVGEFICPWLTLSCPPLGAFGGAAFGEIVPWCGCRYVPSLFARWLVVP